MPTVLRKYGIRFHFYGSDMDEPPHIHASGHGGAAKVWLSPISIAEQSGFKASDLMRTSKSPTNTEVNFWRHGMSSSDPYPENERPVEAWCDHTQLHVRLADGRELVTPLWWYPRLLAASPQQRNKVELMLDGVHWPEVDEDLSVRGMLRGWKYPNAVKPSVAAE